MTSAELGPARRHGHDVDGGGPASCSADVFTARYGLDTAGSDRRRPPVQRCAHPVGLPTGIDTETLSELIHVHAGEAGYLIVPDVESRERALDRQFGTDRSDGGTERRGLRGQKRLLEHVGDDPIRECATDTGAAEVAE